MKSTQPGKVINGSVLILVITQLAQINLQTEDMYFLCHSDIGGRLKGKTCITAVIVIELVSGISTTLILDKKECPQGAEFRISFDKLLQLADFLQDIPEPNLTFFKQLPNQQLNTSKQPLG